MICLRTGCKLNFGLRVGAKRPDGYHELETIFYPLRYPSDELCLCETGGQEVLLDSGKAQIPGENILLRTWQAFAEATGCRIGLGINLQKRVPIGAGLGGGSANAAALLLWLNSRASVPLSQEKLGALGARLGADVPFFLLNQPAIGRGIGERLERVAFRGNGLELVLVAPDEHLQTHEVYELWDALAEKSLTKADSGARNAIPACVDAGSHDLGNDLEIAVFAKWPQLRRLKERLLALGAKAAAMSGSGSAFYGIFADRQKAIFAVKNLRREWSRVFHLQLMDFGM